MCESCPIRACPPVAPPDLVLPTAPDSLLIGPLWRCTRSARRRVVPWRASLRVCICGCGVRAGRKKPCPSEPGGRGREVAGAGGRDSGPGSWPFFRQLFDAGLINEVHASATRRQFQPIMRPSKVGHRTEALPGRPRGGASRRADAVSASGPPGAGGARAGGATASASLSKGANKSRRSTVN